MEQEISEAEFSEERSNSHTLPANAKSTTMCETLPTISDSSYFSHIDLQSAFIQLPITEDQLN
ncbi:hypothetical protein HK102_008018, partial [Quaeritorhiza haematococci]